MLKSLLIGNLRRVQHLDHCLLNHAKNNDLKLFKHSLNAGLSHSLNGMVFLPLAPTTTVILTRLFVQHRTFMPMPKAWA